MYQRWVVAVVTLAFVTAVAPLLARAAAQSTNASDSERDRRITAIHERFVFADIHAHPSAFHRAKVDRIDSAEIGLIDADYFDDDIGKIMGGNFFRAWQQVSR